jgi:glycosyltransferase involved in cell wall biosynthesis
MRILFSGEDFYPPKGGAEISILTLLERMKKENEIEAICTHKKTEIIDYEGIKVYHVKTEMTKLMGWPKRYFLNKTWLRVLDHFLENKKYDLVITHTTLVPASVSAAKKHGIPVLTFIRGYDHFCLSHMRDVKERVNEKHNCLKHASWLYKIQYPFFKELVKWHRKALENSDLLFSNSKFIQSMVKKWYNLNSEVFYPSVQLTKYRVRKRNLKYITMMRPRRWKGVDIFLKIADAMPNKDFLAVGDTDKLKEVLERKNIKYIPWTNDMKSIYSVTKILLLPSIWHEPFSRVPLEAMCNGIPCIGSNTGGTPEEIGDAGIVVKNLFNINEWVNAINKLENKNFYKELEEKSKKQVEKFDFEKNYKKLEEILKKIQSIK